MNLFAYSSTDLCVCVPTLQYEINVPGLLLDAITLMDPVAV